MRGVKFSDEDLKLIKELQAKLASDGLKLSLGKTAGYAARKVLLK